MQVVYMENGFTETLLDIFLSVIITLHSVVVFWGFHCVWNKIYYNRKDYWGIQALEKVCYHVQRKQSIFLIWFLDFSGTGRKYLIRLQTSQKLSEKHFVTSLSAV